ncbi:hypothetical protein MG296_11140 [Flavobacteriaceae bacterium TK19130]|nr:hypothetical protein [Thermobacterium salinum]
MHQKLILEAFRKAMKEINRTEHFPAAQELVNHIEASTDKTYTARSLAGKYIKAKRAMSVRLKSFLVPPLCSYLGYANFEAFKKDHPTETNTASKLLLLWRKCWFKFTLYHIFLMVIAIGAYNYILRERWMVWEENHYVEVDFDSEELRNGRLKLFRQDRIDDFRRIETDCSTEFFNPDGSPKVFYGKNNKGEYEWFTDLAQHPETGKPLKSITPYMIKTHICPTNDD